MKGGEHILITGGAGCVGSFFASELLGRGYRVTAIENLLYGGDALLVYLPHPDFHFVKNDICKPGAVRLSLRKDWPRPTAVFYLAALFGLIYNPNDRRHCNAEMILQ